MQERRVCRMTEMMIYRLGETSSFAQSYCDTLSGWLSFGEPLISSYMLSLGHPSGGPAPRI